MRKKHFGVTPIVAVCLLVLLPLTAHAQSTTSTAVVEGQANDPEGLGLPGATVVLSSPDLIGGDRTLVTDANGSFRFPALPPGVYTVTVTMQGFASQEQGEIRVTSGTTLRIVFTLNIGVTETVTVGAEPPLIDTKSAASANLVLSEEVLQSLPSGRNAEGLINFIPGVISDVRGGPEGGRLAAGRGGSARGGTSQGIQFMHDGVLMNDPQGGEMSNTLRMDFDNIAEAGYTGVGADAQVGGYSGIIVNLISKAGSNELHGAANFFYVCDECNSQNSDDPEFQTETRNNKTGHVDLGGPLVLDKLWAYGSYRREVSNDRAALGGELAGFNKRNTFTGKLTWQVSPDDKLSGNFNLQYRDGQQGSNRFRDPEATNANFENFRTFNLDYLRIFSQDTFLEAKFGVVNTEVGNFPDSESKPPGHRDIETGRRSVSPGFFFDGFRNRYQTNVALTHYADDFVNGSHDFKAGLLYDWSNAKTNLGNTGNPAASYVDYLGEPLYRYDSQPTRIDPVSTTMSVFVQDAWTLENGRVTINPGIRLNSWNGNVTGEKGAIADFPTAFFDLGDRFNPPIEVAPRLGFAADLLGDGTTALRAHWGRYYAQLISNMYGDFDSFPGVSNRFSIWNPVAEEWVVQRTSFAAAGTPIDPDIRMVNFTEFSVGIERKIASDVSFAVAGIIRNTHNFMDRVRLNGIWQEVMGKDQSGQEFLVFNELNPENSEFLYTNPIDIDTSSISLDEGFEQRRDHWAIDFTVEKRFTNNWQMMASYVFSRTTGTDNTDFQNDGGQRGTGIGPSRLWTDPNKRFFADGPLNHDNPHQIKIIGSVKLPYEIFAGFFYNGKSGRPYQKEVRFRSDKLRAPVDRFVEARGARRNPWQNYFDLRVEKAFTVGRFSLSGLVDVFNLLNTDVVTEVRQLEDERSNLPFGRVMRIAFPRNVRLGIRMNF